MDLSNVIARLYTLLTTPGSSPECAKLLPA